MAAQNVPLLTPQEYLDWEAIQSEKHGYISGHVYNMAGASYRHNVSERDCITLPSDQKVRVREMGPFFYPDVSVACEPIIDDKECLRNPVVTIEVLSESTDHLNQGEKWSHYRQLESLRNYVLLSQTEPLAEHYSRASGDQVVWSFVELRGVEVVLELSALTISLPLGELYRRLPHQGTL